MIYYILFKLKRVENSIDMTITTREGMYMKLKKQMFISYGIFIFLIIYLIAFIIIWSVDTPNDPTDELVLMILAICLFIFTCFLKIYFINMGLKYREILDFDTKTGKYCSLFIILFSSGVFLIGDFGHTVLGFMGPYLLQGNYDCELYKKVKGGFEWIQEF